ncbi:pseudouridine synthase [Burkholderia pseudomallei]|nr:MULTISPECIES: hypothetical protein [Burkholderia]AYE27921.1 pseudouridine synthase [Burkholderia pseudomallei]MBD2957338.1 pseudouridine synthase [Burkholderia pseudomallei]MBD2976135.1 pseudouridine synthase [Burkholderia pseudomallei]MBF3634097.1 pseudouridine synthase [Burkholderia pseudomallei]MBF3657562.1 pseudouridine synthase [Burkholderia pseudomallei]
MRSPTTRPCFAASRTCGGRRNRCGGSRRSNWRAIEPARARHSAVARAASGARPRVDDTAGVCRRGSGRPDRAVRGGQADRKRLGPRSEGLIVAGLVDNIRFVYEPYKFVRWE